jgi:hypothetical protein
MSKEYKSKLFTGVEDITKTVEDFGKTIEDNYSKLNEKAKTFTDENAAPIKKYVDSLKSILETYVDANKELLKKSREVSKDAFETAKSELEKTRGDITLVVDKAREELKVQKKKGTDKLEDSIKVVKGAASDVKSTIAAEKPPVKKAAKKPARAKKVVEENAA